MVKYSTRLDAQVGRSLRYELSLIPFFPTTLVFRLYNAYTYEHLQDVDIEPYVTKMLGECRTTRLYLSHQEVPLKLNIYRHLKARLCLYAHDSPDGVEQEVVDRNRHGGRHLRAAKLL